MYHFMLGLSLFFAALGALFLAGGTVTLTGGAITWGLSLLTVSLVLLSLREIHYRWLETREALRALERRQNQILEILQRDRPQTTIEVLNQMQPGSSTGTSAVTPPAPVSAPEAHLAPVQPLPATVTVPPRISEMETAPVSATSGSEEGPGEPVNESLTAEGPADEAVDPLSGDTAGQAQNGETASPSQPLSSLSP